MNLEDKVVIVTGASQGIGAAIALALAEAGCQLALVARNTQKLTDIAAKAKNFWAKRVATYGCDLQKTSEIASSVSQIHSDFWAIDVLINNAGIWQKMMQLDEVTSDTIDSVIQTNLTGLIHMTNVALPILRQQDEAAILNISSQSGIQAQDGQSVYTATKYWVRGFTDVLKKDLKESNVRVAWVYQAGTNTDMFASQGETMPLEKFTDPADLADVIKYMLWLPPKVWMHEVRVCN